MPRPFQYPGSVLRLQQEETPPEALTWRRAFAAARASGRRLWVWRRDVDVTPVSASWLQRHDIESWKRGGGF